MNAQPQEIPYSFNPTPEDPTPEVGDRDRDPSLNPAVVCEHLVCKFRFYAGFFKRTLIWWPKGGAAPFEETAKVLGRDPRKVVGALSHVDSAADSIYFEIQLGVEKIKQTIWRLTDRVQCLAAVYTPYTPFCLQIQSQAPTSLWHGGNSPPFLHPDVERSFFHSPSSDPAAQSNPQIWDLDAMFNANLFYCIDPDSSMLNPEQEHRHEADVQTVKPATTGSIAQEWSTRDTIPQRAGPATVPYQDSSAVSEEKLDPKKRKMLNGHIRALMLRSLKIPYDRKIRSTYLVKQFTTLAESAAYDNGHGGRAPTLEPMRPCWEDIGGSWNLALEALFVEHFNGEHPDLRKSEGFVQAAFRRRLERLRKMGYPVECCERVQGVPGIISCGAASPAGMFNAAAAQAARPPRRGCGVLTPSPRRCSGACLSRPIGGISSAPSAWNCQARALDPMQTLSTSTTRTPPWNHLRLPPSAPANAADTFKYALCWRRQFGVSTSIGGSPYKTRDPSRIKFFLAIMANDEFRSFAELCPPTDNAQAINCLLFLRDATLLLSGGDDQVVRLWDVAEGECLQELRDPQWGQITALSWLPDHIEQAPVIFIGTGRGVVSTYPFSNERTQTFTTVAVFMLDDSVEVQALDLLRSRFAVASHSGQIRMFDIQDIGMWPRLTDEDIPRAIFFHGDQHEHIAVHTCCMGEVIYSDSDTGNLLSTARLHGGIGSVSLSEDGSMKAVHNLSSGNFDVYYPPNSPTPITLSIPTETTLIKTCAFTGDDGRTLVCAGDNGTIHVFELGTAPQRKTLSSEGSDSFYVVTAFSTPDYHFIAAGETEEPASILIWRKPTQKRLSEEKKFKKLLADKENVANQAAMKDMETKVLRERLIEMERKFHHRGEVTSNAWPWVFLAFNNTLVGSIPVGHED
ncbi:hypothetical protein C8R46DRAFT_1044825 [Mycena filopes]|nr:hypothetical protein C8R46DRAFT_1044825 [Mycena filopes]